MRTHIRIPQRRFHLRHLPPHPTRTTSYKSPTPSRGCPQTHPPARPARSRPRHSPHSQLAPPELLGASHPGNAHRRPRTSCAISRYCFVRDSSSGITNSSSPSGRLISAMFSGCASTACSCGSDSQHLHQRAQKTSTRPLLQPSLVSPFRSAGRIPTPFSPAQLQSDPRSPTSLPTPSLLPAPLPPPISFRPHRH